MPQQEAGSRSDKLLSDQKVYISRRILIVRRTSHKQCSKSYIALFLSNTHLRRFYSLVKYRYYPLPVSIRPQFFHKLFSPPKHYTASLYTFSLRHITITMSGRRQILPPLPHVEDEMEQDTTEYQVERFSAQSPWQPTQLPWLLEHTVLSELRPLLRPSQPACKNNLLDYRLTRKQPLLKSIVSSHNKLPVPHSCNAHQQMCRTRPPLPPTRTAN